MNRSKILGFIIIGCGVMLILFFVYFIIRGSGPAGTTNTDGVGLTLPFGIHLPSKNNQDTDGGNVPITPTPIEPIDLTKPLPRLEKLSDRPASGYGVFDQVKDVLSTIITKIDIPDPATGKIVSEDVAKDAVTQIHVPRLRYMDRTTGSIYQVDVYDTRTPSLLTDDTIPWVGEVLFGKDNSMAIRYSNDDGTTTAYRAHIVSSLDYVQCSYPLTARLTSGMQGRNVEHVQALLQESGYPITWQPGTFDSATQNAVLELQKKLKMKADGIVGKGTNQYLRTFCQKQEYARKEEALRTEGGLEYRLVGDDVIDNVAGMALSPDRGTLFAVAGTMPFINGFISTMGDNFLKSLFQLPFSDWITEWPTDTIITLTTKASGLVPGALYTVGTKTGKLDKVIDNESGLTIRMSPNGSRALYSRVTADTPNSIEFGVFDMVKRTFRSLSVKTLPEKCVWRSDSVHVYCAVPEILPSAVYPDAWYQHSIVFDDTLFDINVITGETRSVDTLADIAGAADVTQLQLSQDESHLFFVNQTDHYLWGYRFIE